MANLKYKVGYKFELGGQTHKTIEIVHIVSRYNTVLGCETPYEGKLFVNGIAENMKPCLYSEDELNRYWRLISTQAISHENLITTPPASHHQNHNDHELADNTVLGKTFTYCRTCKVEV